MTVKIRLTGLKSAKMSMNRIQAQIVQGVIDTNADIAKRIRSDARRNVPVFRGNLRKSIVIETAIFSKKFIVRIGSRSKYAMKVEMGYSGMKRLPNISSIKEWVAFKGLPEAMIMPLALKIKQRGSKAQPYLVPSFDKHIRKYADMLRFRLSRIY